jgi:hypothetical protein
MIGKIIGAIAGSRVAKHTSGVSEPFGAVAGVATASVLRRMSLPAMIALAAGGYAAKKLLDRKQTGPVGHSYTPITPKPQPSQPAF